MEKRRSINVNSVNFRHQRQSYYRLFGLSNIQYGFLEETTLQNYKDGCHRTWRKSVY